MSQASAYLAMVMVILILDPISYLRLGRVFVFLYAFSFAYWRVTFLTPARLPHLALAPYLHPCRHNKSNQTNADPSRKSSYILLLPQLARWGLNVKSHRLYRLCFYLSLYSLPSIVEKRVNPPGKADLVLLSMEANQNDPEIE